MVNLRHETIGVVGVGLLGSALVQRLTSSEFSVVAFDTDPVRQAPAVRAGAVMLDSAREVASRASRIMLSLPTTAVCGSVLAELEPVFAVGDIVLDTTTGDPDAMSGFAEGLASRGIAYLDTSVSGSSTQVGRGEAILLVGGERSGFDACVDIFERLASRTFYLGRSGSGARMKLVVNLALGLHRAVLAEALAFAESYGLDAAETLEVLRSGPAYSRVMDGKGFRMARREFEPEARLAQHAKDVRLILEQAEVSGALVPLSTVHLQMLDRAAELGLGSLDNSAIIELYRHDAK